MISSPNPTAELVELGKSEPFCSLDTNNGSIGIVDSDFHHGSRGKYIDFPLEKLLHYGIFFPGFQSSMNESDGLFGKNHSQGFGGIYGIRDIQSFRFFYQRGNPKYLSAHLDLVIDHSVYLIALVFLDYRGMDWFPGGGIFIEDREILIPIERQGQSSRNRGRRHVQYVGENFSGQAVICFENTTLIDSETVLFIDHHESEFGKMNIFFDERMGSDNQTGGSGFQTFLGIFFLFGGQ